MIDGVLRAYMRGDAQRPPPAGGSCARYSTWTEEGTGLDEDEAIELATC